MKGSSYRIGRAETELAEDSLNKISENIYPVSSKYRFRRKSHDYKRSRRVPQATGPKLSHESSVNTEKLRNLSPKRRIKHIYRNSKSKSKNKAMRASDYGYSKSIREPVELKYSQMSLKGLETEKNQHLKDSTLLARKSF
jgi:hypothetical protein